MVFKILSFDIEDAITSDPLVDGDRIDGSTWESDGNSWGMLAGSGVLR